jgi:transcriptional regulator with GAF, ATPase, and Fis domain
VRRRPRVVLTAERRELRPRTSASRIKVAPTSAGLRSSDELSRTIVGCSAAVCALRAYLPKVAQSAATVLITGATGSGKECVAQAIHATGPRAAHPFVAVNCAALPDALIESELFGHERGAFTGAIAASVGHFGRANRGTLYSTRSAR